MQKDYHSVSFSSCRRTSGTPEKYVLNLSTPQENVRQVRLGTLELPHMVQPNVVDGRSNRLVLQEINDSAILVKGVTNVVVNEDNNSVTFTLNGVNYSLTAGGGGNQFRQYEEDAENINITTTSTFISSAASFISSSDTEFDVVLYQEGALDLSQPLYITSFTEILGSLPVGTFTTGSYSPSLEFRLDTSYYSTQELLDHFNARFNIGFTNGQPQTFRYKLKGEAVPQQQTLFNQPGVYRVSRTDILDAFASIQNVANLLTFNVDGGFDFDLSNLEYLDFTQSDEALVNMLGVDKTMYFESFSSTHHYYPDCQQYLIHGRGTASENGAVISWLTLAEPLSSYYLNQVVMIQRPANPNPNLDKTDQDYEFPLWTMAKIAKIEGNIVVLDRKVDTRLNCYVKLFPEPRNIYQMTANTELKFELMVRLPYNNNRVRILQENRDSIGEDYPTNMNKILGLNKGEVLESDATQRVIFPNQYNTDPIPYILMNITNLGASLNNHTHVSHDGTEINPLAKIVLQSPFHINRHQIMEMDFVSPQKITRLEIEFRNPDGTLCYFQGRDHTMTLGFVIDRPTLAITSGSLTGMIDPGVRLG